MDTSQLFTAEGMIAVVTGGGTGTFSTQLSHLISMPTRTQPLTAPQELAS